MHHYAQAVDVVTHVGLARGRLLGCHVAQCAGGLLEDGVGVGVGQAEVNQLHVVPVTGDHDVAGLQVAVHDVAAVHVGQCVEQLFQHAVALVEWWLLREPLGERRAIDPLEDDASPQSRHIFHAHHLLHAGVLQLHEDFHLLAQHFLVHRLVLRVGSERLERMPPTVALGAREHVVAARSYGLPLGELSAHALETIYHKTRYGILRIQIE